MNFFGAFLRAAKLPLIFAIAMLCLFATSSPAEARCNVRALRLQVRGHAQAIVFRQNLAIVNHHNAAAIVVDNHYAAPAIVLRENFTVLPLRRYASYDVSAELIAQAVLLEQKRQELYQAGAAALVANASAQVIAQLNAGQQLRYAQNAPSACDDKINALRAEIQQLRQAMQAPLPK